MRHHIGFQVAAQTMYSSHDRPEALAFRSREEWSAHLALVHGASRLQLRADPDWSTQMLVEVVLGVRPSSGFSIRVIAIDGKRDALTVKAVEDEPEPGQAMASVMTQPSVVVVTERRPGPIALELAGRTDPRS
jgi:hypothetical protein